MGKRKQRPQANTGCGRTNLIRVKSQLVLGLAEKDLNRPSFWRSKPKWFPSPRKHRYTGTHAALSVPQTPAPASTAGQQHGRFRSTRLHTDTSSTKSRSRSRGERLPSGCVWQNLNRDADALGIQNSIGLQGPDQVITHRRVAIDDTSAGKPGIDQHVPTMRRKR
ncbi:hypothetical protein D3C81_1203220 [compost metagenome]